MCKVQCILLSRINEAESSDTITVSVYLHEFLFRSHVCLQHENFQLQVLCSLLSRTCNDIPQETNQKVELGKTHERGSSSHKMLQSKETKSGKLIPIR